MRSLHMRMLVWGVTVPLRPWLPLWWLLGRNLMPTREQIKAKLSDYVDEGNLSIAVAAIEDLLDGAE